MKLIVSRVCCVEGPKEGRRKAWRWQDVISWLALAILVAGIEWNTPRNTTEGRHDVKHNATDTSKSGLIVAVITNKDSAEE